MRTLLIIAALALAGCPVPPTSSSTPAAPVSPAGPTSITVEVPTAQSAELAPLRNIQSLRELTQRAPAPKPAPPAQPKPQQRAQVTPPATFRRRQKRRAKAKRPFTPKENARHEAAAAKAAEPPVVVTSPAPAPAPKPKPKPKPPPAPVAPVPAKPRDLERDRRESLAAAVEATLLRDQQNYNRDAVRDFQARTGLVVDGIYGPRTAGALQYYLGRTPPKHYLKTSLNVVPYDPASPQPAAMPAPVPTPAKPSAAQLERERRTALAAAVERTLQRDGKTYDRTAVKNLQRRVAIAVDGIYGPQTAGVLQYYLGRTPPAHYLRTSVQVKPFSP